MVTMQPNNVDQSYAQSNAMSGHMGMYNRYLELSQSLKSNDHYMDKLDELLTFGRTRITNKRPARFADFLFCGSKADAHDVDILKSLKITHVLNCAPRSPWKQPHQFQNPSSMLQNHADIIPGTNPYKHLDCDVKNYLEVDTLDNDSFPILRGSYEKAKRFINEARESGGRVLVHCELGMNRSISICLAYVMDVVEAKLLTAVKSVMADRPNILTNQGFRKQLVEFARERNLLE